MDEAVRTDWRPTDTHDKWSSHFCFVWDRNQLVSGQIHSHRPNLHRLQDYIIQQIAVTKKHSILITYEKIYNDISLLVVESVKFSLCNQPVA